MDEIRLKALDVVLDFSKQQITFAGILVSVTLAFLPRYLAQFKPFVAVTPGLSWLVLVSSIVLGLSVLGRAAHHMAKATELGRIIKDLEWMARFQFAGLVLGVVMQIVVVLLLPKFDAA